MLATESSATSGNRAATLIITRYHCPAESTGFFGFFPIRQAGQLLVNLAGISGQQQTYKAPKLHFPLQVQEGRLMYYFSRFSPLTVPNETGTGVSNYS